MNNAQHNLVFVTIKPMLSDKSMQAILGKYGSAQTADSPQIGTVMRSTATMDAIKGYILNHNLKPGDPLPTEAELCADLGVSRSSVREAFRQLTALDIVTVHQGRGSFVGSMSLEPLVQTLILRNALDQSSGKASLRQVVSTRQVLDLGIAEDVVRQFSGTHNPKLHALVATMVERAKAGKTYLDEDIAFHEALTEFAGDSLISQLISAMWLVHQAFIPSLETPAADELIATAKAHQAMLEAAEAGDIDAYKAAVCSHYGPLAKIIDL
ncbi:FadR/GntR family transcriptional regulator [Arcanobacterium haemolyticum]|uniref:Regulatory protein GntR HTH n=2 Tax=Arcanobacterium haemolyticum TaxID=28264 RepID=D7BMD7_ARCHD|nr:GntR family transcriptional regulator [Arcanobacterium haemolyticum]ADH92086.1 regulatory protein GntR HTH [Arcanobacterium haemolyticum DSM 20595]SPT74973.1 L-lactate utilization operon repressor [Arcanobacterium haemolyticum]SQH29209.1 L-lactate utilization operon repressor [Arcanobacterium haemolyticum]